MKKLMVCLISSMGIMAAFAQLQTGENLGVTTTDAGKVRGYVHNTIYTFKGIPYAEAKRFEAPQKPKAMAGHSQFIDLWPRRAADGSHNNRSRMKVNLCFTTIGDIPAKTACA
jgi:hypothetical protein